MRPPRIEFPGALYHVIARGNDRRSVFRDDADRQSFLARLARYRERHGFRLYAYCLMDNHVHLAIETGETPLSQVMHDVLSSYTQAFNLRHDRVGHLFQGRYKAYLVQKERYLLALLRYIHENPVRARVVRSAAQYAWSSDRAYRDGEGPEWLDFDPVLRRFGRRPSEATRAYRRFLGEADASSYEEAPSHGQLVKGDEEYADEILAKVEANAPARKPVPLEAVVRAVGRVWKTPEGELRGPGRRRELSEARLAAAYLARRLGAVPVARTARHFHREASTVTRGVARLAERLASDRDLARRVETAERAASRGGK